MAEPPVQFTVGEKKRFYRELAANGVIMRLKDELGIHFRTGLQDDDLIVLGLRLRMAWNRVLPDGQLIRRLYDVRRDVRWIGAEAEEYRKDCLRLKRTLDAYRRQCARPPPADRKDGC